MAGPLIIELSARAMSDDVNKYLTITGGGVNQLLLGTDFRTFRFSFAPDTNRTLSFSALRGGVEQDFVGSPDPAGSLNNNDPFTIEIESITVRDTSPSGSDIRVQVSDDGRLTTLPSYRVTNARDFEGVLPDNVAVFDNTGVLVTSPEITDVRLDARGFPTTRSIAMLRDISIKATGKDQITCDFLGDIVDDVFDAQEPWLEIAARLCSQLDLVVIPNTDAQGITIVRRRELSEPFNEFVFTEVDVVQDLSLIHISEPTRPY